MQTANVNKNLVDNYYELLRGLSPDNKLELIARLSMSMKTVEEKNEISLESLYGSFISDQSADEFVDDLKKSRNFNRKRVDL